MSRLSCCFCVMGSKKDVATAATLRPRLFAKYVELERRTGYTMQAGRSLEKAAGFTVEDLMTTAPSRRKADAKAAAGQVEMSF